MYFVALTPLGAKLEKIIVNVHATAQHAFAFGIDAAAQLKIVRSYVGLSTATSHLAECWFPFAVLRSTPVQAGGMNPTLTDLAQPPHSPLLGQGVCDLRQACGVGAQLRLRKSVDRYGRRNESFALVLLLSFLNRWLQGDIKAQPLAIAIARTWLPGQDSNLQPFG